jgi:hypothetical protein
MIRDNENEQGGPICALPFADRLELRAELRRQITLLFLSVLFSKLLVEWQLTIPVNMTVTINQSFFSVI